jgi:hypothetical protein
LPAELGLPLQVHFFAICYYANNVKICEIADLKSSGIEIASFDFCYSAMVSNREKIKKGQCHEIVVEIKPWSGISGLN